jgi:hypothetical protein
MAGDQVCAGYLMANMTFRPNVPPMAVSCFNQTLNGWGPPQQQSLSCCDETARFAVQIGFSGGFSNIPGHLPGNGLETELPDEKYNTECAPYIDNLQATLCDANQGKYVKEDLTNNQTVFRICKSSCDLVYKQCQYLLPKYNWTSNITNGTEFCHASWGSFDFQKKLCPAVEYENFSFFPCATNLQIDVVENNCIEIITPTSIDINSYRFKGYPIDACAEPVVINNTQLGVIVGVSAIAALAVVVAIFLYCWILKRRKEEEIADDV